jgi:hypothetical protein
MQFSFSFGFRRVVRFIVSARCFLNVLEAMFCGLLHFVEILCKCSLPWCFISVMCFSSSHHSLGFVLCFSFAMAVLIDVEYFDCKLNQMVSVGLSLSNLPVSVSDRAWVRQFLETILVERVEVTGLGYSLSFRGKIDFLYEPPGPLYFSAIDVGIPLCQQFGMRESLHAASCGPSCLPLWLLTAG